MITGKNYIGGELSSNSSVSFKTFNPLLNIENSISFYEASDNEIEKSTKLANDAFKIFKQVSSLDTIGVSKGYDGLIKGKMSRKT